MRRLLVIYLALCGLLAHVVLIGVPAWHYQRSGMSAAGYLIAASKGIRKHAPELEPLADAIDVAFFDSGLLIDPAVRYPADLVLQMPRWRGSGANALRRDTQPRYDNTGRPIASVDDDAWDTTSPSAGTEVHVASVHELISAIDKARPGQRIVLSAGHYRIETPIAAHVSATARMPIVITGEDVTSVVIELSAPAALELTAGYWALTNVIVRGNCTPAPCAAIIDTARGARALTVRNVFVSGVSRLVGSGSEAPTDALIDGVTMVGGTVSERPVRITASTEIPVSSATDALIALCAAPMDAALCQSRQLKHALKKLPEFGVLLIRSGSYAQAAAVRRKGIVIVAEPGARLHGRAFGGKAAIVSNADLTIDGLECLEIIVPSGNGACVRQQAGNLTLRGVHFHRAQMGLLTGPKGGVTRIEDSYIHDAGFGPRGALGHNVYVGSGELEFIRSWSVAARRAGHEIKSRAARTVIRGSIVASANARDSRLVDVPDGGTLEITDSILMEGPRSENWELIGYGLELRDGTQKHSRNRIEISSNTVYFDSPNGSNFLHSRHVDEVSVHGNTFIGAGRGWPDNVQHDDREDAGVAPYPFFEKL